MLVLKLSFHGVFMVFGSTDHLAVLPGGNVSTVDILALVLLLHRMRSISSFGICRETYQLLHSLNLKESWEYQLHRRNLSARVLFKVFIFP